LGGDGRREGQAEERAAEFGDGERRAGLFVGYGPGAGQLAGQRGDGVGGEVVDVDAGDEVRSVAADLPLAFADGDVGAAPGAVDGGRTEDAA